MFVNLINCETGHTCSVNTDHIISIWSEQDQMGWEITYCKDIIGDVYKKHIAKESFLKFIGS